MPEGTVCQDRDAVIRLTNVSRRYVMGQESVDALADVSIDFERGSFWAVMGPSGSGKSTLLNVLGCLDRITAGSYLLAGEDVAKLSDDALSGIRLRRIGFVFQSFNLIPQLTVAKNIELPLYYLGVDARESRRRASELAAKVGLSHRLEHRPMQLSGGQMQRVAIARALANDPEVLLADEPTGNLDSKTGREILALLLALNRQGKTIIMVTHEQDVAAVAGRTLHMRDGRIESTGENASPQGSL